MSDYINGRLEQYVDINFPEITKEQWKAGLRNLLSQGRFVEPVELSGAKVSRVTLHNYGLVAQNQLKKGDTIEIVRSGEVIPKFLSVVSASDNEFSAPTNCPSCDQPIVVEDIRLICKNDLCPDKVQDEILNFLKKIGIDDLSSKRLEEMIKVGLITDIPSLYQLTKTQLLGLDKVQDKLATKIISNIEKSKNVDLITFLSALGISGGAYNKCEKIVSAGFDTIDKVMNFTPAQLETVESFAEKSATDFVNSLQSKKEIVDKLRTYDFKLNPPVATTQYEGTIGGLKFCFTGTLSMKRY